MDPYYRLFDVEAGREILTAVDVDGFFVSAPQPETATVRFIGATLPASARPQSFEDVDLRVINRSGGEIAHYYIGAVDLTDAVTSDIVSGGSDALTSFGGYSIPYPQARGIWRRWASDVPVREGEWRTYPPSAHPSWLHVVQQAWFGAGRRAKRYSSASRYVLDGEEMASMAGFYCALGEAVNGPGGYFGSNPDALEDCLTAGEVEDPLFQLLWRNYSAAEQKIDKDELRCVLSVLQDAGIDVVLRPRL